MQARTNGYTISAIRRARGIPQAELAAAAGISPGYLCNVEAGRKHPLARVTGRIADALDVPVGVLTGRVSPIAVLREIAGLTVRQLAAAAGITTTRLQRIEQGIEQGTEDPAPDLAAALADRLGCPVEALLPVYGRPGGKVA